MYVVLIHRQYLKENQLNLRDNDHDLLVNYHPNKKKKNEGCLFNRFKSKIYFNIIK
jgi:hypothetical protein